MVISKLKSWFGKLKDQPHVEFLCQAEDWDVIPKPYPARSHIPDWFKALPPRLGNQGLESSTIKRCMPFLDAMSVGWIIPLAADVEFTTNEDASGLSYRWNFYKPMLENHNANQISTDDNPNPNNPKPPIKFLNYWAIKMPPGYSMMFVPPINRPDPRFTCISGLVDCDGYFEYINFPFFFNEPNWSGIIPAGTPLVQAIPFKRDALIKKTMVKTFSQDDYDALALTRRKRASHESLYKDNIWTKK
jgi:hypothetical protein